MTSPLLLRAWSVRFQLENLTEDINELIAEFEAICAARFPHVIAAVPVEGSNYMLEWDGKYLTFRKQRLLQCSRESRALCLSSFPWLWEAFGQ